MDLEATGSCYRVTFEGRQFEIRPVIEGWAVFEVQPEPEPLHETFRYMGKMESAWKAFGLIVGRGAYQ